MDGAVLIHGTHQLLKFLIYIPPPFAIQVQEISHLYDL